MEAILSPGEAHIPFSIALDVNALSESQLEKFTKKLYFFWERIQEKPRFSQLLELGFADGSGSEAILPFSPVELQKLPTPNADPDATLLRTVEQALVSLRERLDAYDYFGVPYLRPILVLFAGETLEKDNDDIKQITDLLLEEDERSRLLIFFMTFTILEDNIATKLPGHTFPVNPDTFENVFEQLLEYLRNVHPSVNSGNSLLGISASNPQSSLSDTIM